MKKVNSIMVARAAGVAQSTVSLVANNSSKVAPETRRKVIDAARRLGYTLHPRNKRLMIGVIISRMNPIKSWQQMVLSSLKREIYDRQYRMEIICSDDIPLSRAFTTLGSAFLYMQDESFWGDYQVRCTLLERVE